MHQPQGTDFGHHFLFVVQIQKTKLETGIICRIAPPLQETMCGWRRLVLLIVQSNLLTASVDRDWRVQIVMSDQSAKIILVLDWTSRSRYSWSEQRRRVQELVAWSFVHRNHWWNPWNLCWVARTVMTWWHIQIWQRRYQLPDIRLAGFLCWNGWWWLRLRQMLSDHQSQVCTFFALCAESVLRSFRTLNTTRHHVLPVELQWSSNPWDCRAQTTACALTLAPTSFTTRIVR